MLVQTTGHNDSSKYTIHALMIDFKKMKTVKETKESVVNITQHHSNMSNLQ